MKGLWVDIIQIKKWCHCHNSLNANQFFFKWKVFLDGNYFLGLFAALLLNFSFWKMLYDHDFDYDDSGASFLKSARMLHFVFAVFNYSADAYSQDMGVI